jgi:hypothetical protein
VSRYLRTATVGLVLVGGASAQILVNSDIAVSTTWTANNVYNLQQQIYVLPGATLTIQAGTLVASTTNAGGSLAVCKGAQIFVQGTEKDPVIMTSTADTATWVGNDPHTGTWHEGCAEWGNLTLMGNGYISANGHTIPASLPNTPTPNAANVAPMEGLLAQFPGDTRVLYGGGNDDDDSGSIAYCSLRYGGKVTGFNTELNGLSMGGIGRATDVHHVEIMNNVDDGIETWGGAVNYKYVSIWNIGDDNFDFDEGWRGKLQFGLLVVGYSIQAARGSGVGDHAFEMDGAEDSDWQPVSTNTIYNCTVIGQPNATRGLTAWRDNDRTQFRNCIFMDAGGDLVKNDNSDGDGASGYGFNGTLTWAQTWTTPYTATSTVNAPGNPAAFYQTQTSGNLAEITDSIFYNLTGATAYTEATNVGVLNPAKNNVQEPATMPIMSITRGPAVLRGVAPNQIVELPVIGLDPRPTGDALTSAAWAPYDGFFSSAHYRGAFAPGNNWLKGWTASEAYGFTPSDAWGDLGYSMGGVTGDPVLAGTGTMAANTNITLSLSNAASNSLTLLGWGFGRIDLPLLGGVLVPNYNHLPVIFQFADGSGNTALTVTIPPVFPTGVRLYAQEWVLDAAGPQGFAASNAIYGVFP